MTDASHLAAPDHTSPCIYCDLITNPPHPPHDTPNTAALSLMTALENAVNTAKAARKAARNQTSPHTVTGGGGTP
jgi:hypothetical protein